jgi:hypothetical protein
VGVTAAELAEFTHGDGGVEQQVAARVVRGCRCRLKVRDVKVHYMCNILTY